MRSSGLVTLQVMTVNGPVDPSTLGVTLPHEHVLWGRHTSTIPRPKCWQCVPMPGWRSTLRWSNSLTQPLRHRGQPSTVAPPPAPSALSRQSAFPGVESYLNLVHVPGPPFVIERGIFW